MAVSLLSKRAMNLSKSLRKLFGSVNLTVNSDHLHISTRFRLEFWKEVEVELYFYTENATDFVNAIRQK